MRRTPFHITLLGFVALAVPARADGAAMNLRSASGRDGIDNVCTSQSGDTPPNSDRQINKTAGSVKALSRAVSDFLADPMTVRSSARPPPLSQAYESALLIHPEQFGDGVNPVCDGVHEDTIAFQRAVAFANSAGGGTVQIPPRTCKVNAVFPHVHNVLLQGHGTATVLTPYAAQDMLTLQDANFSTLTHFSMSSPFSTGSGIVLRSTADNTYIDDIKGFGFPEHTIACEGTSSVQTSGNRVTNSILLSGASSAGSSTVLFHFCNDFTIKDNQLGSTLPATGSIGGGKNNTGGLANTVGLHLLNSSAGHIESNKIWQNQIGINNESSSNNFINDNRVTQNNYQGITASRSAFLSVQGNQTYQNSEAGIGSYEAIRLVGVINSDISGNIVYDWTGVSEVSYGVTFDATSADNSACHNHFSQYVTAPFYVASGATDINHTCANTPASAN